jgi:hypothetical protein
MGENPSPLGEAFKVNDPLAPSSEAGGLGESVEEGPVTKILGRCEMREGRYLL